MKEKPSSWKADAKRDDKNMATAVLHLHSLITGDYSDRQKALKEILDDGKHPGVLDRNLSEFGPSVRKMISKMKRAVASEVIERLHFR